MNRSNAWCFSELRRVGCAAKVSVGADFYLHVQISLEAIRLIELGARVTLVQQLTGLERKVIKRLYRQHNGQSSPAGQMPFSDGWYRKDIRRMLHASVIWQLYKQPVNVERTRACELIDIYEGYLSLVNEPRLNITRASFVPLLVAMNVWHERECNHCRVRYLASVTSSGDACPGCVLYYRHRCRQCGTAMEVSPQGRYRKSCDTCKQPQSQQ